MKRAAALLAAGFLALLLQGVAASLVDVLFVPDLGLLVVVGLGLSLPPLVGAPLSLALGYTTDVLAGALLGQHALLAVTAYALTRLAARQLNLRGPLPRLFYAGALTSVHSLALATLSWLFGGPAVAFGPLAAALVWHVPVNALLALPVLAGVDRLASVLSGEDAARRPLRLVPRSSSP